jgi:hypothetical protein
MSKLSDIVPAGVVTGDDLYNLFEHARTNGYAIPAVNCTRYVCGGVWFANMCLCMCVCVCARMYVMIMYRLIYMRGHTVCSI